MPALPKIDIPKIDFRQIADDFKTLDPKDPGAWPLVPRIIILSGMFVGLLMAAAWFGWNVQNEELELKYQEEIKLKDEWLNKKKQAVNLDEHINQLAEIERSFGALLKQLPNAAEMESLLIDINQAGLGRGLQFELFKPGAEVSKDFYAELPITLNVTGSYHDFGAFAGDIAKLSRIVTLNDINVAPSGKSGDTLMLVATAKTFRYLDEVEVAEQKRKEREKAKGAKK
ncbi:MAG: type 4a pilus biogenesis protein PilO [Gammaproteobacteria bacterium]|nr:type 4a pilus biogenesis protein PilO [Gammaproteobacteria bacterium]MBU3989714.1 type 4a pilus biogenesis protein PilO [Gammaproteobacteria bacterium]MBU4003439.1 type 4a pilus biogenesis protein PilO [Gammaproteobacteria bacterium]MBU4021910.1 type 4a pilus biogenesis protein PilO [Gammaproteobacteria bacterium]MBU4095847.1 type 4a pilus biogenesis protein PilO [Gammaproteobacteria bacterium]